MGVPLSSKNAETLEKAIEAGSRVQPFVEDVKVRIDREKLRSKHGVYDYVSLTGDMLDVTLTVRYRSARARASMKFIKEINYPLMFIQEITEE